jgi:hypothetical protein
MDTDTSSIRLRENDRSAKLKEVTLKFLTRDSIALKLDKISINKLFKSHAPQNKRPGKCCDYLLLTRFKAKKFAIFIELKSTRFIEEDYIAQFKGAECLLDYCGSVLARFYSQADLLESYEKRFVLFYKTSINKKTTRLNYTARNDSPERALRYANPHDVALGHLVPE